MTQQRPQEEIELKLVMDKDALARLPRTALLRSLKSGRISEKSLASTYYDTPALFLKQHGMALRVRHDGSQYVQTLKAPLMNADGTARADGGLQHLREFEVTLEAAAPDLSRIEDPAIQAWLTREGVAEELEPVFTTDIARQVMPLGFADSAVELAMDTGHILANGDETSVAEAELELKSGRPDHLYELAMMLHRKFSFRVGQESKAARGYGLYSGHVPKPQKAAKPKLSADMTAAQAFERQARACLWQMRANEAPVLDGRDPEGVHQMRVGIRRLRALVTTFKAAFNDEAFAFLRGELRWMQQQLGSARDWDVFLEETYTPLRRHLPSAESLACLETEAEALRAAAYDKARAAVHHDRYTALLLRLQLWLDNGGWRRGGSPDMPDPGERPLTAFAKQVLDKRAKSLKKLGKRYHHLSEPELHEMRIAGKKLRYASEFMNGVFSKKAQKTYLNRLEAIQDRLGAINDAATGQELLDQIVHRVAKADTQTRLAIGNATGLVQGWQVARIDHELSAFESTWAAFRKVKPFWK